METNITTAAAATEAGAANTENAEIMLLIKITCAGELVALNAALPEHPESI